MNEFSCKIAQNGFFAGPVHFIKPVSINKDDVKCNPIVEKQKLDAAKSQLVDDLQKACGFCGGANDGQKDVSAEKNAEVCKIVLNILNDEAFITRIVKAIEQSECSAACAVMNASMELCEELDKVSDAYIRSRQEDIRGAADRLISILNGDIDRIEKCSLICAMELSPAQLLSIDKEMIGAIITYTGSLDSHVSVVAESLGIPYLYGNMEAVLRASQADFAIVDALKDKNTGGNELKCISMLQDEGSVVFDPAIEAKEQALLRMESRLSGKSKGELKVSGRTKICANILRAEEVDAQLVSKVDGIGLFRSEFAFLNRDDAPTEDEQFDTYSRVLKSMGEKPVVIRVMDIGADKKVSWLNLNKESNPALGIRGIRALFENSDIFNIQLRALLRAGIFGNLKVMFPMIANAWEIDAIKEMIEIASKELEAEGVDFKIPQIGIMIETPAAALCADELATKVDFFSVGTNDLAQYTLAIDREAKGLDKYYNTYHESLYKLIEMTVEAGHRHGISVSVCGRLAADANATARLLQMGVDELSVPIKKVGAVRDSVLKNDINKNVLQVDTAEDGLFVAAAADGYFVPMDEIPDPVFSGGLLGKCFGILPENGFVYSPVSGQIVNIAGTRHAIGIKSDDGREYIVHVGIDTVSLGECAFKLLVAEGDFVQENQLLMEADIEMIKENGLSPMIVVVAL